MSSSFSCPELETPPDSLVPVRLRVREGNMIVEDEFFYDVSVPPREGGCPVAIARGLAEDLNLPSHLAPSIAVAVVEQTRGVGAVPVETEDDDERASGGWRFAGPTCARRADDEEADAAVLASVETTTSSS